MKFPLSRLRAFPLLSLRGTGDNALAAGRPLLGVRRWKTRQCHALAVLHGEDGGLKWI